MLENVQNTSEAYWTSAAQEGNQYRAMNLVFRRERNSIDLMSDYFRLKNDLVSWNKFRFFVIEFGGTWTPLLKCVKYFVALTFISLVYMTLTDVSLPPTYLAKLEGHELREYVKVEYTSVLEEMMRY